MSVAAAPATAGTGALAAAGIMAPGVPTVLWLVWLYCNARLLCFLTRERGVLFGVRSTIVHFVNQLVMVAGISWGTVQFLRNRKTQALG